MRFSAIEYCRRRDASLTCCSARMIPATIVSACVVRLPFIAVSSWRPRTARTSPTCRAGWRGVCRTRPDHLGEGGSGRIRYPFHGVNLEPLQQGVGVYRRAVDEQLPILRRDRHTLDLDHGNQRAELRLLTLFRPGIA